MPRARLRRGGPWPSILVIDDLRAKCCLLTPAEKTSACRQIQGRCWCVFSAFRQAKHTVPACPTKPWRSREGRLDNRPALQRRLLTIPKSAPSRRAGEPSSLKIIRITKLVEKSDQASRFFVLNRSLGRFTPALRDGTDFGIVSNRRRSAGLLSRRPSGTIC